MQRKQPVQIFLSFKVHLLMQGDDAGLRSLFIFISAMLYRLTNAFTRLSYQRFLIN
jgi:hypothetical protein